MLIGLAIRDVVLVEALDLAPGPGLTALTGETGAGKSIILDALGLATGARADAGLVRTGAERAGASAVFRLSASHPLRSELADRGLDLEPADDLILRRQLGADGRSRAWVGDQPVGVTALREVGAALVEVHGQHETVGLLDARTHRPLLDAFGGLAALAAACAEAWRGRVEALAALERLRGTAAAAAGEAEQLTADLAELDRLDPREGEELALAEERALLSASEKALAELAAARTAVAGDGVVSRLAQGLRALERARERAEAAGVSAESAAFAALAAALDAAERTLIEAEEAVVAVDRAVAAFEFDPDRLEKTEERLFALRAAARRLKAPVDALPAERVRIAAALRAVETADEALAEAEANARAAEAGYTAAAEILSAARRRSAADLERAVSSELPPLKLDKARFRVAVDPLPPERHGPQGADRVAFQIATVPGAPFGALDAVASGGELARLALALKVALAGTGSGATLIFDEVDQGVGGAVADAVGQRLKRLAETAQVLVVTHSPQIAARAETHWRVGKSGEGAALRTHVQALSGGDREEEIARMLAGAEITDAARAAARALLNA